MATAASLLERMTGAPSAHGPVCVSITDLFTGFARSFWVRGTRVEPYPSDSSACLVVGPAQVGAFCLTGSEGWASYEEIVGAFTARNRMRGGDGARVGAKTSPLPRELAMTGTKLIVRDCDEPIQCLVSTGAAYPRRAWVGAVHPSADPGLPYVIAGLLNSTLGWVLYRRLARVRDSRGHDLSKAVLGRVKVPFLGYDSAAFQRAVLLSYRLHCLCAAGQEVALPDSIQDEDVPNHHMRLLSELVRLYGFDDREARLIVESVLPEGSADVMGVQGKLFYRPKEPLEPVHFLSRDMVQEYEALKERRRRKTIDGFGEQRFDYLSKLLAWEHRTNSPIASHLPARRPPGAFTPDDAIRLVDRFLSETTGQALVSLAATRISSELWEVEIGPGRPPSPRGAPDNSSQAVSSRPPTVGRLWVNARMGTVADRPEKARDAAAAAAAAA